MAWLTFLWSSFKGWPVNKTCDRLVDSVAAGQIKSDEGLAAAFAYAIGIFYNDTGSLTCYDINRYRESVCGHYISTSPPPPNADSHDWPYISALFCLILLLSLSSLFSFSFLFFFFVSLLSLSLSLYPSPYFLLFLFTLLSSFGWLVNIIHSEMGQTGASAVAGITWRAQRSISRRAALAYSLPRRTTWQPTSNPANSSLASLCAPYGTMSNDELSWSCVFWFEQLRTSFHFSFFSFLPSFLPSFLSLSLSLSIV